MCIISRLNSVFLTLLKMKKNDIHFVYRLYGQNVEKRLFHFCVGKSVGGNSLESKSISCVTLIRFTLKRALISNELVLSENKSRTEPDLLLTSKQTGSWPKNYFSVFFHCFQFYKPGAETRK